MILFLEVYQREAVNVLWFTVQRLRDLPFAGHIRDYEYLEEKSMHHHQETTRERQDGAWILFLTASPKNSSLGVRTCC